MTRILRSLGFWLALISSPLSVNAQLLQFDRFFPAAVSLGHPSLIAAEGKFPAWPVEIFCDREDVKISCGEKAGELRVEADAKATPGCAWVRLADSQSASSLKPLLIESTSVQLEQEPNGAIREATAVSLPATVFGRLDKNEDVDTFRFDVKQGQLIHARVIANHILGSDMDAVLQLTDLNGNVLKQSDDEVGTDPQLVIIAARNQTLVARIFAFPETPNSTIGFAGAASFLYAIQLSHSNVVDHFLPLLDHCKDLSLQAFGWQETKESDNYVAQFAEATSLSPRIAYIQGQASWQWLPRFQLGDFSISPASLYALRCWLSNSSSR